jgi:hypothetical protein
MHENREISCTSWTKEQDRSAKAMNRTADMNVQEKSDCAVVPVNQPNNEGQQPSAEAGEKGRRLRRTSFNYTCVRHRAGSACPRDCTVCGKQHVSPLFIHSKSRMRKSARTDLRGGRSAMVVPTATVIPSHKSACGKSHQIGTEKRTCVYEYRVNSQKGL